MNNGKVFGEYMYIETQTSNMRVSIQYYPSEGDIAFTYFTSNGEHSLLTMLNVWPDSTTVRYNSGNDYCKITGNISMSAYNQNYPLSYSSCDPGYYDTDYNLLEDTRLRINFMLREVNKLLLSNNVGVSLNDIGFSSFN